MRRPRARPARPPPRARLDHQDGFRAGTSWPWWCCHRTADGSRRWPDDEITAETAWTPKQRVGESTKRAVLGMPESKRRGVAQPHHGSWARRATRARGWRRRKAGRPKGQPPETRARHEAQAHGGLLACKSSESVQARTRVRVTARITPPPKVADRRATPPTGCPSRRVRRSRAACPARPGQRPPRPGCPRTNRAPAAIHAELVVSPKSQADHSTGERGLPSAADRLVDRASINREARAAARPPPPPPPWPRETRHLARTSGPTPTTELTPTPRRAWPGSASTAR